MQILHKNMNIFHYQFKTEPRRTIKMAGM